MQEEQQKWEVDIRGKGNKGTYIFLVNLLMQMKIRKRLEKGGASRSKFLTRPFRFSGDKACRRPPTYISNKFFWQQDDDT